MFEVFEHTADLGMRVRAQTLPALFVDAARGLFSLIVANPADVRPVQEMSFWIEGQSHEYLLFDWLNELLFTFDAQHLLFSQFDCRLRPGGLEASARGEPVDPARHRLDHEVKAITYHGLKLEQRDGAWLAELIVDI